VAQEADEAAASGLRPLVGRVEIGPRLVWSDAETAPGSPLAGSRHPAGGSLTRPGLRVALELDRTDRDALPRRGWRLDAEAAGWAGGDLAGPFTESSVEVRGYVPLPGAGTHLAARAGGSRVSGAFPVQHSSYVGGQGTLRGHRWQRFRGDAAAWGSAEARVPVAPLEVLVRWNVGAFAFADAGRVWLDGDSPGGWHRGYGGGIWLEALGRGASLAYARGEGDRLHLKLGLPF
jgi:hypothetical protein